ncbi:hypothetical protein QQ020_35135 [Fulvivirgaceae bacterium BMA12]|uniref:Uncharacterized protein n=1 Tax=Agaribacillus aureus TaxID=3051825 RepID=A0ABT8LHT7_9BACT|nr:hypothetical protein [Fulvivirgaceae bacterium BMA12]
MKPLTTKIGYKAIFVFFFSVAMIFLLLTLSKNQKSYIKNGFTRHFPPNLVKSGSKPLELDHNLFYFAGISGNQIYLGNTKTVNQILETDHDLSEWHYITFDIGRFSHIKSAQLIVDSPNFYMMDGITPLILAGDLNDRTVRKIRLSDRLQYYGSESINSSSFLLRAFDQELGRFILIKQGLDISSQKIAPKILEKQIQGIFCTRGRLHYDKKTNKVIFLYDYRNEYIQIDTNLNVEYRAKTIDTVSHAQIKVAKIHGGTKTVLAAPPLVVNKNSCVWDDKLFVHSMLIADNEDKETYKKNAVIDVYSLGNKGYLFSFYIPGLGNNKMRDFKVYNKVLLAIFDRFIIKYQLNI